ncbi:4'-phosphopantetheinyl transferase superfamily protein [Roseomonas frigidaquae]|uniref:4'-phosphopantetheinyl transferase superfamily protein n=1 Tax=Falsiroseomonas frigidaquae TaxID=487318 RepID=A0ABX1EZF2_9PROT|nr:4'-phosphopantetheinyl transferase superfamily protein [Falsiroseomonas frigidaquae]NKE45460.1 4'-phosphopantetheinyl transferase superfamily protein [Falsiroseomonas frigidaquae]
MARLTRGAVRLRWVHPDAVDAPTLAAWHATLDAAEQDAAARFRFEADRRAYIAAHALARLMLAEAAGLPAPALRFLRGPQGKPELDPTHGLPWLRFNLSHTRSLVACALAAEDDIGLDVEDLSRREAGPGLAERYFAPAEAALLEATPPADRHATFLRIWTLKEAYVKATGQGISAGLDSFAFTLDPPRLSFAPGGTARWRFLQWQPTPGHILAVALRRKS